LKELNEEITMTFPLNITQYLKKEDGPKESNQNDSIKTKEEIFQHNEHVAKFHWICRRYQTRCCENIIFYMT